MPPQISIVTCTWRVISNALAIEVGRVTSSLGSLSVWQINVVTFVNTSIATAYIYDTNVRNSACLPGLFFSDYVTSRYSD
jgi:hypothetical protein